MPNDFTDVSLDDLARPAAFAKRYPDLIGNESRLRYLLRDRQINGLSECGAVVERGRMLFIVKSRFLDWLLSR